MSDMDDNSGDDSGPSAEDLAEAKKLGWADQSKWRGDPALWVDADEFLRRGREILPIVRASNSKLTDELAQARKEISQLKGASDEQSRLVKDLLEHQAAEIKRQVESRLAGLRAEKKAAIREGDNERAADLDEEIDQTKDDLAKANAPKAATAPGKKSMTFEGKEVPDDVAPWAEAFQKENADWLQKDKRKTSLFMGICEDLYETTPLRGAELLAEGKKQMEETLSPAARKTSKSEGGSGGWGGSGGGASGGDGKSFGDLPADARAACNAQAKKFVGEGTGKFKTNADWQKYYTKTYFESQASR